MVGADLLAGRGEPERPTRIGQWGESSAISSVSSLMLGEPSPLMPLLTSPWSAAGWTGPTQSRSSPLRSSYLPKHRSVRAIGQWYQSSNSYHHLTGQRGGEPGEESAFPAPHPPGKSGLPRGPHQVGILKKKYRPTMKNIRSGAFTLMLVLCWARVGRARALIPGHLKRLSLSAEPNTSG